MTVLGCLRRGVGTVLFVSALCASAPSIAAGEAKLPPLKISSGTTVTLEYTLTLEDKTVLESNVGREPMTYEQGAHEIVPGLERALEGLAKGEKKRVVVKPEDGYGAVDPKAFHEVKKSMIPEKAWKVGTQLEAKSAEGESMFPVVTEVKEETVVLNFNHPLAGKTLIFDVTVVDVRPTTKKP